MARLQTAVLCNAATIEQSGLVSVLGAFIDTITGPALPIRQQLWFVARFLFEPGDEGAVHNLVIVAEALDVDDPAAVPAGPLVRIEGQIGVGERPPDLDPRVSGGGPIVVPLPIEFPTTGVYHVALTLNGDLLWDSPLLVKLAG